MPPVGVASRRPSRIERTREYARRHLDLAALLAASSATALRYARLHAVLGVSAAPSLALLEASPGAPPAGYGWWSWWDQSRYIEAALAWSHGVLAPADHWYLPGYPLLGAAFARLTPDQPFMLPDLACMVGALWLFAALAARLLGDVPHGRALGAAVFVATAALPNRALWSWVVPWTTTPEAPCLFGCLLAAARFLESRRPRDAFFAALAGTATAGFRSADAAAVVVAVSGAAMGWTLVHAWPGWRRAGRVAAAAFAGAAIPAAVFGSAYLAVFGLRPNGYLTLSGAFGFEWRLLPLRWVALMIDPKPLFPDGQGLAAAFPWIAPGVAGMAACLVTPLGVPRRLHALVIGATLLDCALFLAYRDLHPTGLWRFGNFHYFKWTLPVFGLYAVQLLRALARPSRWPALATATAAVLGLFFWRTELIPVAPLPAASSARDLSFPSGLPHLDDALLARADGDWVGLYGAGSAIRAGDRVFRSFYDFKVFLRAGVVMVLPLRAMPAVPSTLQLAPGTSLDLETAPILARQTLSWGLPCPVLPDREACRPLSLLPSPPLPLGTKVALGSAEDYLLAGWSDPGGAGRWPAGRRATLRFALPPLPAEEGAALEITGRALAAPGCAMPTRVAVAVNGRHGATWRLKAGATGSVRVPIPRDAAPGGTAIVVLDVAGPRQSWLCADAAEPLDRGLYVEAMELVAAPGR